MADDAPGDASDVAPDAAAVADGVVVAQTMQRADEDGSGVRIETLTLARIPENFAGAPRGRLVRRSDAATRKLQRSRRRHGCDVDSPDAGIAPQETTPPRHCNRETVAVAATPRLRCG